jgi:hypothetical protein
MKPVHRWTHAEVAQHEADEAKRHAAYLEKADAHRKRLRLRTRLLRVVRTLAYLERAHPEAHALYTFEKLVQMKREDLLEAELAKIKQASTGGHY